MKKAFMPYRALAVLLALICAGLVLWYGALFALAGRSGMRLRDLAGERAALGDVALEGTVQDNTFEIAFTVTGAGVQNRFDAHCREDTEPLSGGFYDSVALQPAPDANTSELRQVIDENGRPCYEITTDLLACYVYAWGAAGRDLVVFDSSLRCAAPEGGRFVLRSDSMRMEGTGPQTWQLCPPGEGASEADQAAYSLSQSLSWRSWRTRAGRQEFFAITANGETEVFCINRWGSSTDVSAVQAAGTGLELVDYSHPVGAVSLAATLRGTLLGAAPAGADSAVLVLRRQDTLTALALNEAGEKTDEALLLALDEGQSDCEVHFCSPVKTSHVDLGLVLYPFGEAVPDGEPWLESCAAALRLKDGRFAAKELLRLADAGAAARFLGAGFNEAGTRLVTVQQRLPSAADQPPAGLLEEGQYLAGEVSIAVWQQGQRLYEGILAGDWRQDAWRSFPLRAVSRRSCCFGQNDPYGGEMLRANPYLWSKQEVALQ